MILHSLISALLTLGLARVSFHSVHISYGDLKITNDTVRGEVTYFKDDWHRAVDRWYAGCLPTPSREEMERQYLKSHLRFWSGNFHVPIAIDPRVSKNSELSVTYGFQFAIPAGTSEVLVDSRAMFSEYGDQMNLLTVETPTGARNLILDAGHPTSTIKL